MKHTSEEKVKLNAKVLEHADPLIASLKNEWLPYYEYIEEATGLPRIEIIMHLLRNEMQNMQKGLAAQGEKVAPILDKLKGDIKEDEDWRS